jgi:anaerobic magnesium-protoporphyrin IX monomethyl ester cyclase
LKSEGRRRNVMTNSKMDVVFVVPENLKDLGKSSVHDAIEPPLDARVAANHLIRRGASVDLFDANVLNWTPKKMAQEVVAANPHVVGMSIRGYNPSASHQTMVPAGELVRAIKEESPQTKIIFFGTHPSAVPKLTLETEPTDYVCGGEGPITVYELLQAIKAGARPEDIRKVRSLWYWEDGVVRNGPPAPLLDLNQEPICREAWDLMHPKKHKPHHWQRFYKVTDEVGNVLSEPYANPFSSAGCPFHCTFCEIQAPNREGEQVLRGLGQLKPGVNSFRQLDPALFLEEVTYLVEEYGVMTFKMPDEMFGIGSHPVKIAELVKERFGDSLNFWCYFRVDTCNPRTLDLLRSAGFRWIALGIEAADSKVRSGQDKHFTDERIHQVVQGLSAAGINAALNFIFGLTQYKDDSGSLESWDTMESMERTFLAACEQNGAYGNFYFDMALPGSEQYRIAKLTGYPLPERPGGPGWLGVSQYTAQSEPFYPGSALTPKQILAFRDWAHVAYYAREEYRRKLANDPNFGEIALQNIDEWMGHLRTLKRDLFDGRAFWEMPKEEQLKLVPFSGRFTVYSGPAL